MAYASGSAGQRGKSSGASASKRRGSSAASLFDLIASGKESAELMEEPVALRVHVGSTLPREHVLAARDALMPERPNGLVEVLGLEAPSAAATAPDAVLMLCAPTEPGAGPLARWYAESGVACAFLAESALDVEVAPGIGAVCAAEASDVPAKLGAWLARAVESKVALAACFPCCRAEVAGALALPAALENAAVGAVALIPGADFPVMTANQAKLVLRIAAAHGRVMGPARAPEVVGTVAAGLVYRSFARVLADALPGLGWAVKPAVAFLGTEATARLAVAYLDGRISPRRLLGVLERVVARSAKKAEEIPTAGALMPAAGQGA